MKQEMMGWKWYQLDHMQIICTSLQTDNHANTSSLNFFRRPDALPDAQPTVLKQTRIHNTWKPLAFMNASADTFSHVHQVLASTAHHRNAPPNKRHHNINIIRAQRALLPDSRFLTPQWPSEVGRRPRSAADSVSRRTSSCTT